MLQRVLLPARWTKKSLHRCSCSFGGRRNHISTVAASALSDEYGISEHENSKLCSPNIMISWVSENKLYLKYPRLSLLENDCVSLNQLNQVLSYIFVSGLHLNPFVMSRVVFTCIFGLGKEEHAKRDYGAFIFSQINKPNIFSWNTMIRAFSILGKSSSESVIAFRYYMEMLRGGLLPDKRTYPSLLQACRSDSDMGSLKQVHCHAVLLGLNTDLYVGNSLLNCYLMCGSVVDAWTLFDEMTERDVVSWTTLISGLVVQGCYEECLLVFKRMMADDLSSRPNVATVVSIMSGCANLGSLDHTQGLHSYLEKAGWMEVDVSISNSLIDAYAKCGSIRFAERIFHEVHSHQRDRYTWTAMVAGLAIHGRGKEAIKWFSEMNRVTEIDPDAVMFIAALSACAHSGLVDEGLEIFQSMEKDFDIVPEVIHYGCMVDLLSRAGFLEYAYAFIERMPMEPNLAILGSLLSACRVHNNIELGETVQNKIEYFCEYNDGGGARVLLSNMYANRNRWEEAIQLREGLTGEWRKSKPPGRSWIQVKGFVQEFVVGDKANPQTVELQVLLDGLCRLLCLY